MDEAFIKKVLPHSDEAERSVIGSMIMDKDAIIAASELVIGEDFYQKRYGVLYDAMIELFNEGKPVDLITLQNKLKEKDVPPELCSLEFIRDLIASVPLSANIRYYANIVKEKSTLRQLIKVTESITNECYLDKEKIETILEDSEKKMFDILQKRNSGDFVSIRDVVFKSLESIEAAAKNKGSVTGVATGFYDLDYKTAGLQPSDLILIAARPSMGKTAFVLNIAEHVVLKGNTTTAIFSLEMSKDQLVKRIMAMHSKVNSQAIRTGELSDEEWLKLVESARMIGNSNLIIDDTSSISIGELRSKCRKFKLEHNLGLVIIDYLQLMTGSKKSESRQQEISEISRSLKGLARELSVPVIALSQLSRAVEQRPDKRPMLSDLRESGAIEQDADIVMFLYRDDYYNHDSEEAGISEVIIGKQRNGPTGTVKLAWLSQFTKFANLERQNG
ncbi:replicative DNA helicase [Anaerocolumna cellulosilytica]|uniref:Replicative DNA helicase n=1 Tax=Anaerocolumna cellulosilytica TaxID=433286 RepID=A0A6S6R5W4_9FIRM|nr:replicative DNA helicase [Anaerocolumna cellulosilytica]MBB5195256.1 replicative DNA helicase [Anaerocolumna cellulosilytica]BCJ96729.1 replicative DNA helicase [Anaerocolumna cellulosilytica]